MSSSFNTHFNPVEVEDTNTVESAVEEEKTDTVDHPITPSPRKKRKKFIDTTKKLSNTNSMYGAICKRGFALLFCEAGNPATAKNYLNPGSRRKAWSIQFDKDLKEDNLGPDFPIISSFQKRRNTDREGDAHIEQLASTTWGMTAYLGILEQGEDNSEGLKKFANTVCSKMNVYAAMKQNNCHPVNYRGDITEGVPEADRKSLDHFIVTEFVVKFARGYYSEEIDEEKFYSDANLIDALFGREENTVDPMSTMSRYD